MGRWAQRRVAGGGQPTTLIAMVRAIRPTPSTVRVNYSGNVQASAFDPSDFETDSSIEATAVTQFSPNQIVLDFGEDVSGSASVDYSGDTVGILTPQSQIVS